MKEYTSLQNVKDDLEITVSTYDNSLNRAIKGMSRYIDSFVGYDFEKKDRTEKIDIKEVPFNGHIYLTYRPVNSVSSINLVNGAYSQALQTADYFVYPTHIFTRILTLGYQVFQVTYNSGYLIDWANQDDITKHTLPADIEMACRSLVVEYFNTKDKKGLKSENVGAWSRTFMDSMSQDSNLIKSILNNYAIPSF